MPSELHEFQSKQAAKWGKKQGFSVVGTNITAQGSRERVDLIAFRSNCSIMIESKVSRADFLADSKKPERQSGGVGTYRLYITPVDLILPEDLPERWGLLYLDGKRVIEIVKPQGNMWPSANYTGHQEWRKYTHQVDESSERSMLFSLARRLVKGESILK